MNNEQKSQEQQEQGGGAGQAPPQNQQQAQPGPEVDGLADKKPEELTPEELRLMADTMPGEGPGD